jgi:methyl-accepting chemotaxis protein
LIFVDPGLMIRNAGKPDSGVERKRSMKTLQDLYFNLSIKARIVLLCICYSGCMVTVSILGRSDSALIRWGSLVLFIAVGGFFSMLNISGITTSIDRVLSYLKTMSSGDLTQNIAARRNNEISQIIKMIAEVQSNMRSMISGIQSTSEHLNRAAGTLRHTSETMSAGAEQAVGQSDAVVTAVEDLSSVSADIAQNCQLMAHRAAETASSTVEGERTISQMSQMMGEIGRIVAGATTAVESLGNNSQQIGDIVGTIEDIADQTNLLALNAAIEAARAGEQGRGFAVVADEVRRLAERTSIATHEIQKIIGILQRDVVNVVQSMGQSAQSVKNGEGGARLSSQAMSDIKAHIEVLNDNVSQVATAIEEQSATTAGVRNNIRSISDVISAVSLGTSETGRAASDLAGSSAELKSLTSRFRL